MNLTLRGRTYAPGEFAIMAIVNRTPDSFYDKGATFAFDAAMERVDTVVGEGADIVDIGGVKAAPGGDVDVAEELDRTLPFVVAVRERHPEVIISVDTWRHEVAEQVCQAGADLINDTWSGADPLVAEVAAQHRVGLVCSHVGQALPRTRPFRVAYDDVTADVLRRTVELAERAVGLGVPAESILIDPTHDFGKNTTGWSRLAGRCSSRCPIRTSSVRRSAGCRWTSGTSARSRPPRSRRGRAPGSTAPTTSRRRGRCSTWSPRSRAPGRPGARCVDWSEPT